MTIIEYGPNRPHKGGFIGLRVFVKRVGDKPYQKYLSLNKLSEKQIEATWMLARHLEQMAKEDAIQRLSSKILYKESRCPISPVHGISMYVTNRQEPNGGVRSEFAISVCLAELADSKSGVLWRKTKAVRRFTYEWLEVVWAEACRQLAAGRQYKATPTAWLWSLPDEATIVSFINSRSKSGQVEIREACVSSQ